MSNIDQDSSREFYCFISYKHQDGNNYKEDQSWAEALEGAFYRLKIKVPPVSRSKIINNPNGDSNEYVERVYRDFTNLSAGYYKEEILKALNSSRKLISIVSDEMLADQNDKLDKASEGNADDKKVPWCYKEIRDYLQSHTLDDVIIVYIGKETNFSCDLVPRPLLMVDFLDEISEKKRVFSSEQKEKAYRECPQEKKGAFLEEYWNERNNILVNTQGRKKDLADLVAAKIACNIFDVEGEGAKVFVSYRMQELAKQRARWWITGLVIVLLIITIGLFWQRGQVVNAFRYLEQAKTALANNDSPKAMNLSLEAEKAGGSLQEIKEFLWEVFENDYTKPFQIISNKDIINSPDNGLWEIDAEEGRVRLINGKKPETISFPPDEFIYDNLVFSPDGNLVALSGYDSIYVYNRADKRYIFSTPYHGSFSTLASGQLCFSPDNKSLFRHWNDSIIIHSLSQREDTIIYDRSDGIVPDVSEVFAISHTADSLYLYTCNGHNTVESWPLLADFTKFEYNPSTHSIVTISNDTVAFYSPNDCRILRAFPVKQEPVYSYDKESDRFVLFVKWPESNGYRRGEVVMWEKGHFLTNTFAFSDVEYISFGQDEDVLLYSEEKILVWRYPEKKTFTLDASECKQSELNFGIKLISDDDRIILKQDCPGTEDDYYASFFYPDFGMQEIWQVPRSPLCDGSLYVERHYQYGGESVIRVYNASDDVLVWEVPSSDPFEFGNNWIRSGDSFYEASSGKEIVTLPDEDNLKCEVLELEKRIILLGKHDYKVYSLEDGTFIYGEQYPFPETVNVIETDSFGDGFLYVDLRNITSSDTSSGKCLSWLISIELENGLRKGCIGRDGVFFLSNDGNNIILSSDSGDILILNSNLATLRSLNIGEYVAGTPKKATNGKYYAVSNGGNLYCCSFEHEKAEKVSLPYRAISFGWILYDGRYCLLHTEDANSGARFLYDLVDKRIALYLLPEETIEKIDGGNVMIQYHRREPNLSLKYTRPLLTDRALSSALRRRLNGALDFNRE